MKKALKIALIVVAFILVIALLLFAYLIHGNARVSKNRKALQQLYEEEKNCCYYSEDLNAYFIAAIGHCGQMIVNGSVQDIFYGDSMPYDDAAVIEPIDGPVYFHDGCYDDVIYGTDKEDWILWGSVKYVSDGIELKILKSSILDKEDYPKTIKFTLYLKDDIDLFEKGFTRVYNYDYETGVITVTCADGTVETYERGTSISRK